MVRAIQQSAGGSVRSVTAPAYAAWVLAGCLALVAASACSREGPTHLPRSAPPNLVLIVADDLGWMDVGYHGAEIPTPNIDRIVREGVELDRFYTTPICSPTRAGLLTGVYPIRFGLQRLSVKAWHERGLPPEAQTIAEALEPGGYERRGLIGKWHLGRARREFHPLEQGFTHFYGHYNGGIEYSSHLSLGALDWHRQYELSEEPGYSTRLIGAEAVRFVEESPADEPFFLMVSFNAIHAPDEAPAEALERVAQRARGKRRMKAAMTACIDRKSVV
jgi:arylsulfatase B